MEGHTLSVAREPDRPFTYGGKRLLPLRRTLRVMNIQKFSKITGISVYTIRYYEKIGILRKINRNSSGHRSFTDEDIVWAEFIKRLKDTGMPLEQILEYANLREQGPHTSRSRMDILENHARNLEQKISNELFNLKKLREKIKYYKSLEKTS